MSEHDPHGSPEQPELSPRIRRLGEALGRIVRGRFPKLTEEVQAGYAAAELRQKIEQRGEPRNVLKEAMVGFKKIPRPGEVLERVAEDIKKKYANDAERRGAQLKGLGTIYADELNAAIRERGQGGIVVETSRPNPDRPMLTGCHVRGCNHRYDRNGLITITGFSDPNDVTFVAGSNTNAYGFSAHVPELGRRKGFVKQVTITEPQMHDLEKHAYAVNGTINFALGIDDVVTKFGNPDFSIDTPDFPAIPTTIPDTIPNDFF